MLLLSRPKVCTSSVWLVLIPPWVRSYCAHMYLKIWRWSRERRHAAIGMLFEKTREDVAAGQALPAAIAIRTIQIGGIGVIMRSERSMSSEPSV